MSNEQIARMDIQQLNYKMVTMATTSSTVNTIQNSITEHVLNNELNNFVTNNKLNSNAYYQLNAGDSSIKSKLNDSKNYSKNHKIVNGQKTNNLSVKTNGDNLSNSNLLSGSHISDDKCHSDTVTKVPNQMSYNNGQFKVGDRNQSNFNHHNQISKLITDDYLTEHEFNYLINTDHLDYTHNSANTKQTSPMMNHHTLMIESINEIVGDDSEDIFEDSVADNLISEQEIKSKKSLKSEVVDIETMKSDLAKLKLSKEFDSLANSNNLNNSSLDELNDNDNEYFDAIDEEIDRKPLIRSTSLKTGKSKNLEPENKKMVRFADAMGLDLAKIKNISQEDLPNVPASAFQDLKMCKKEVKEEFFNSQLSCLPVRNQVNQFNQVGLLSPSRSNKFSNNKTLILSNGFVGIGSDSTTNWPVLVPEFVQPFTQFNFLEHVRNQRVCLESCVVSTIGNNLSVDCIIRVQNISFEKSIMVRYTSNNWKSWLDSLASYIPNSCDGQTDRFSVKFYIKSLTKDQCVKFAIKYLANSEEFWDNNRGRDYCLLYKT